MISVRKEKNNRNQHKWGKYTYWVYLLENRKAIAHTHINANSELDKKLIHDLFNVVREKYKNVERLKVELELMKSEIKTFFDSEFNYEIVEDNNVLNEIIEYVKDY